MGAQEVVVSRTIAASPRSIWEVLVDVRRAAEVFRSITSVEVLADGEYAPGVRWRETRSMFGRSESHEFTVVAVEEAHRIVLESESAGIRYRVECILTESGDHTPSRPRTLVVSRFRADQPAAAPHVLWRVLGSLGAMATEETLAQDLSDIADAVERPDTRTMVVTHRLFTRELVAGVDLVRGVPAGALHRAGIVADHLETVLNTLVDHHHGEDLLIWPLVAARTEIPAELQERMNGQHGRIHEDIAHVRELLLRWREQADPGVRDELAGLIAQLAGALRPHLEQEENEVLPLVERHLTRSEYDRLVEHSRESLPNDKAALLVQLFLEGASPRERAQILDQYPRGQQLIIRTVGARQYRRYVRRLRDPGS